MSLGPMKAMLEGEATAASLAAARFAGGPLMFMAFTLFVVRWNVLNVRPLTLTPPSSCTATFIPLLSSLPKHDPISQGKAGAIGCTITALNSAFIAFSMDGYSFVPRPWYILVSTHAPLLDL